MKRILLFLLAIVFVFSMFPAGFCASAEEEAPIINEVFDDYATNQMPPNVKLLGGFGGVAEVSKANKAFMMDVSSGEAIYRQEAKDFGDTYVFSLNIKYSGKAPSMTVGLNTGVSSVALDSVLLCVKNGEIFTTNNKFIGGLTTYRNTGITIAVNKNKFMDIYINGTCILRRWKTNIDITTGAISVMTQRSDSFVYLDDIRLYCGKEIRTSFPSKTYNPMYDDNINMGAGSVFGDYTYFDSDECRIKNTNRTAEYEGFSKGPKNTVQTNRLIDYQSPDRQDHIYMNNFAEPTEDCYFDITMATPDYSEWTPKKYSYYLIEGDFMKETFGGMDTLFWIRDSSGVSQQNYQLFNIVGEGKAQTIDGRDLLVNIRKGKWFNYKLAIDLVEHNVDIYIDDKLIADDVQLGNDSMKELSMVRCIIQKNRGKSDIYIKSLRVTGLVKPYNSSDFYHTDVFSDELTEREYLKDKVAMHAYGNQVFANGEKKVMSPESIYDKDKDELYVAPEIIADAFNLEPESITVSDSQIIYRDFRILPDGDVKINDNGEALIPVKEFAKKVLSQYVFSMDNGLIIFNKERELNINDKEWIYYSFRPTYNRGVYNGIDFLNSFMTYQRPDKDKILADFAEKTGEVTNHPRVMASKDDFDALRNLYQNDARYKKYADKLISEADAYLTDDVCTYRFDDAMRALTIAKRVAARMQAWGYAYQITGDKKYADRAWLEFQSAATFPDYNTCHIIDTGEFVFGFAVGYDWMYEGFSEEQREFIRDNFYNKAFLRLASGLYGGITAKSGGSNRYISFIWPSNYNAVVNGGVTAAALAFMEVNPDECAQILSASLKSIENMMQMLMPGGAWIESINYWEYAIHYLSYMMAACDSALGSTYGLENSQGFKETLDFSIGCLGLKGTIGFHDGSTLQDYSYGVYSYLSKKLGHRGAAAIRAYDLEERATPIDDIFTLLYYDDETYGNYSEILKTLDKTTRIDGIELFSVRNTYDTKDEDGLYFGTHFGPRQHYHCNNDEGTFVLDMMGERWAEELGSDNYNLQNEMGYSADQLYRYRTEGQNTFTFNNGKGYNQTGGVSYPIERSDSNAHSAYVVTDLSGLYADVPQMKMGYYVGDNLQTVTMRAEMTADKETEGYWFMHTKAEIFIENGIAYLTKNGKTIKMEFEMEGATPEIIAMDAVPLPSSPVVPQQDKNKEYRKVAVKFNLQKDMPASLTVKIMPTYIPSAKVSGTLKEWKLQDEGITYKSKRIKASVLYNGEDVSGQTIPVKNGIFPTLDIVTEEPDAIVEVSYAQNVDEKTVIRIWDAERKYFTITTVSYIDSHSADISLFNFIPVNGVEVSEEPEPENKKDNMLDNDMQTRWTGMSLGATAVFDMGAVQAVDGVALAFWKGNERHYTFDIEVSPDGVQWAKVLSNVASQGEFEALEAYAFNETCQARFVRFTGNGSDVNSASKVNSNILEFKPLKSKY